MTGDISPPEFSPAMFTEDEPPSDSLMIETRETDAPTRKDRNQITWALFVLVALVGAVMLWAAFAGAAPWERVERASTLLLAPLITLLSTAVGWYFGSRTK